jgi:fatty-acyl-CoA synthase
VEAVTAFVVIRRGEKVTEQEIIDRCKKELAPFKVPKKIVLMDALPKTPTGKILKRDMRASNKELFTQNK